MYVIDFECMLRAAVGTLMPRLVVERAVKLARDVARALRAVSAGCVGLGVGHPRRRGSRSVTGRRRGRRRGLGRGIGP